VNLKLVSIPAEVEAEMGLVRARLGGRDTVLLTPEAAIETAHLLIEAAALAKGQQVVGR